MTLGFREPKVWDQVILVGTKCDRADDEDCAFFASDLVPHFFRCTPGSAHLHALVSSGDCSQLIAALRQLPEGPLLYQQPEAEQLAFELAPLLGEAIDSFAQAVRTARQGGEHVATLNILLLGECGDGKSTLVNALRGPSSEEQRAGKDPRGVTKEVRCIAGMPICGRPVKYYDTPGIGDMDIAPTDLCMMLESILSAGDIDGVIVTCPATNKYLRLGGRLVQRLVDLCFQGEERWASVVLAGTKSDKADSEERANFERKIKNDFFATALTAGKKVGEAVLCSSNPGGCEELKMALLSLPAGKIAYSPPPAKQWCCQVGDLLGIDPSILERERHEIHDVVKAVEQQSRRIQASRAKVLCRCNLGFEFLIDFVVS